VNSRGELQGGNYRGGELQGTEFTDEGELQGTEFTDEVLVVGNYRGNYRGQSSPMKFSS
jgi:hypothetical protein